MIPRNIIDVHNIANATKSISQYIDTLKISREIKHYRTFIMMNQSTASILFTPYYLKIF